jgi:hypothetical protein
VKFVSPFASPPAQPQLAANERVVAEATLGRDTAVLTDRRVVVAGANFEQSVPLAHIGLVRVRFEHTVRDVVLGVIAIVIAAVLFAVASPVRTFLLNQSVGLEAAARQERENGAEGQGLAQGMQRILGVLASAASLIPLAGWLLLVLAAAKIALGIIGRTVVSLTAGGSELAFSKRGRDRMLHDFVAEIGRHLPGPARAG